MAKAPHSSARLISSRAELEKLRTDREKDADQLQLNHPRPSWAADAEDSRKLHIEMRERRIKFLEKRLGLHDEKVQSDFEKSRKAVSNDQTPEAEYEE